MEDFVSQAKLFAAVQAGDIAEVARLLEAEPALLLAKNERGASAVLMAWGIRAEIAMRPGSVKGNKNQIRQDDRLRKSQHERSQDKSAHQCVVHKVGA